jgi:hypothetical protein
MVASIRKLHFILTLAFTFISFSQLIAQSDSVAQYSPNTGKIESESGMYQPVQYQPQFIANLSDTIKETSGLLFFNRQLWTINDSGNQPEMYQIDSTNGNVLRTVVIRNTVNTDWESITQDDSNVYIGDFGNNAGNRKDLRILKITKTFLFNPENDTVNATYIYFYYSDQIYFTAAFNRNNFDCEAFFYYNDSLHLFSKNWSDMQTKHYVLPVTPGFYKAHLEERFESDGLITDAAINDKGNIVLLGYKNTGSKFYTCFTWLFSAYEGCNYFSGNKRRIEIGSALHLGQTEGIVLENDNSAWLSAESIQFIGLNFPAKLFRLDFRKYF